MLTADNALGQIAARREIPHLEQWGREHAAEILALGEEPAGVIRHAYAVQLAKLRSEAAAVESDRGWMGRREKAEEE
jgi:hypothetical protein